ncbi:Holliday junction resolvase RusA (prophage-encoded endonuclease) [Virgibacillus subterraneus]|uniref:Holliday junction resolvase RusA (Prophage-encoded endonuclease) n=1 Tax=Virgibacillus subterraneus TaxID=621109 RepID=A0A1H8YYQ8_9BACI|nr:RusA family crossover junction endodeoxyribonuclease [Virgibacillus subterraneus]SEP57340.1 Holliday junction resolvase RusA (prophage-encoded endonuclease) [Virgibacillus subterraneus]
MIELTIPGRPVPAVRMTQKSKYVSKSAQRYLAYKKQVGWVARSHMQGEPTNEPVGVNIKVYLAGGNQGDIDNYAKSLTDSLNKIAYKDDRQIQFMELRKVKCKKEDERAEIEVFELDTLGNIANH